MRVKSIAIAAALIAGVTLAGCSSTGDSSPDRVDLINQLVEGKGWPLDVRRCAREGLEALSTEELQTLAIDQPEAVAQVDAGLPINVQMSPELAAKREAIQLECLGSPGPVDWVPSTDVEGQYVPDAR